MLYWNVLAEPDFPWELPTLLGKFETEEEAQAFLDDFKAREDPYYAVWIFPQHELA